MIWFMLLSQVSLSPRLGSRDNVQPQIDIIRVVHPSINGKVLKDGKELKISVHLPKVPELMNLIK